MRQCLPCPQSFEVAVNQSSPPNSHDASDNWRSAALAACSHLDYATDAPEYVNEALRKLQQAVIDADKGKPDTAATNEEPSETITVQQAWEWAGGNPGIKATRQELEEVLREMDAVCDEAAERKTRVDEAETQKPIFYMRDNHTFRRLSEDMETALAQITAELDAGHTHGMLCSKRPGFVGIHARGNDHRYEFLAECQQALAKHLNATTVHAENRKPTREDRVWQDGFVAGAKWWEWEKTGATMWQADQHRAGEVAMEKRKQRAQVQEGPSGPKPR